MIFLPEEFISAIKTMENPTVYMKNAKIKKKKRLILVIFVNCFRFSLKTLEQDVRKSHKIYLILDGKKDRAKLEFFKFFRK